jgi:ethanolamine transporter EutH
MGSGFVAAMIALVSGATLAVMFEATGFTALIVTAPILAVGLGGTRALAPTKDKLRNSSRIAVLAGVTVGLNVVFTIEPTAFGLVAPLIPLPALGIADRIYDRGKAVVEEEIE